MTSSIVQTHQALRAENPNPMWLWSMMLTRGLSWDNVWELYPRGVAGRDSGTLYLSTVGKVPGIEFLLSLPDGPTTVLDLFHRVTEVRRHGFEPENHYDLDTNAIAKGMWRVMDHVSYKWSDVQAVLDEAHDLQRKIDANEEDNDDLEPLKDVVLMLDVLEERHPELIKQVIYYAMATQHPLVSAHRYDTLLDKLDEDEAKQLWDTLRSQQWPEPEEVVTVFATLSSFLHASTSESGSLEQLAFFQKHPELTETRLIGLLTSDERKNHSDAYFSPLCELLRDNPAFFALLHANMNRELTVENFSDVFLNRTSRKTIKDVVVAYQQMPKDQRDTQECLQRFVHVLGAMDIGVQNYMTGHASTVIEEQIGESPQGSIAKIFALHACVRSMFSKTLVDNEVKEFRNIFHHDLRSKTGISSIVRKHIPEFKEWLSMVQSLGLPEEDAWQTGLQKLAQHKTPELVLDADIFESPQ